MDQNFDQSSIQTAMKLANSDAGRQLLALLRSQNSDALNAAMTSAAGGDYNKVKENLSEMLASEQVQALLQQLRGNGHG